MQVTDDKMLQWCRTLLARCRFRTKIWAIIWRPFRD